MGAGSLEAMRGSPVRASPARIVNENDFRIDQTMCASPMDSVYSQGFLGLLTCLFASSTPARGEANRSMTTSAAGTGRQMVGGLLPGKGGEGQAPGPDSHLSDGRGRPLGGDGPGASRTFRSSVAVELADR